MKKTIAVLSLSTLTIMSCTKQNSNDAIAEPVNTVATTAVGAWGTVFWDDFTNTTQWTKTSNRTDYNSDFCTYSSSAVTNTTGDGFSILKITATKTGTNAWQSGHVKSFFNFYPTTNTEYHTTAKIKFIAQSGGAYVAFNSTYGAWPAFWHVDESVWPKNGEIDILEAFSKTTATYAQSNLFYGVNACSTCNQLGNSAERRYSTYVPSYTTSGWHTYDSYWANTNGTVTVTTKVDGNTIYTYTNSVDADLKLQNFKNHNLILNMAVGDNGGTFTESLINLMDNTQMWVDYVKVEKRTL